MTVHNVTAAADTFTCNAYLCPDGAPTLVDAGAMPDVVDAIRTHVDTLDTVVLTHQHGDHVAELDAVVDAFDPQVVAYDDHPTRTTCIRDGDTVSIGGDDYDVVYTPGHAADHVAFVSETTVFSGDVVVHDDGAFTGGSFGRTDNPTQSRSQLIESLDRLLDRMPDTVEHMYPGHGGEYHGDVHAIVETARERANRYEPKYPDE